MAYWSASACDQLSQIFVYLVFKRRRLCLWLILRFFHQTFYREANGGGCLISLFAEGNKLFTHAALFSFGSIITALIQTAPREELPVGLGSTKKPARPIKVHWIIQLFQVSMEKSCTKNSNIVIICIKNCRSRFVLRQWYSFHM